MYKQFIAKLSINRVYRFKNWSKHKYVSFLQPWDSSDNLQTHRKDISTFVSPDKYNNHNSTKSDKQNFFFPFDKKDNISYKSFYK